MAELMYITFLKRVSRQRIFQHVLFWLCSLVLFNFVFRYGRPPSEALVNSIGFLPSHFLFVYSLNYFLFPRYVLKGRIKASILGLLVILSLSLLYVRIADVYILHYTGYHRLWLPQNFPHSIYALFSVGWVAVTIKLVKKWYQEKERQQQLEKEKLVVELQLLKSQLHPHFLFNTLNSLYAFSLEKSDQTPRLVLKLSALLRYILYECNAAQIPLETEIGIVNNYLQLESMRFGERLDYSLQFTGDTNNKSIAPLLLLPFVENAIKHGIGKQTGLSWISLQGHVDNDTLHFKLINSRDEDPSSPHATGGLGLQNVKKRLELLYPGDHTLKITADEDTWQVNLVIRLTPAPATTLITQTHALSYETQVPYR